MQIAKKKILLIETFPDTPHLDTSCELALSLKKNNDVSFFWCGYNLPWKDWDLSLFKKILGFNFNVKIKTLTNLLENKGVTIIDKIDLDKKTINQIVNWSESYTGRKNLKKFKYKKKNLEVNLGLSVQSSLLSIFKNYNFLKNIELVRTALLSSAIVYHRSLEVIKIVKPSLIITYNNRFGITRPIIEAAKKSRVQVIRHEVGSTKDKYEIFLKDVHNMDERYRAIYEYWNRARIIDRQKNARKYFNMPYEKVKTINTGSGSVPSFSLNQDQKITLPQKKKIVTFFTSRNFEFDAISADFLFYAKSKEFKDQNTAVKTLIDVMKKIKNSILIIRVHPSHKNPEFENSFWKKYSSENVQIIESQSRVNSFDLLKKSDYVVTYGSTMAIHAAYNNKPSISLRRHAYSKSKVLIEPKNKKQLHKILNTNYNLNTRNKCLPYGNYNITFGKKFKFYKRHWLLKGYFFNQPVNHYGYFINFILKFLYPIIRLKKY